MGDRVAIMLGDGFEPIEAIAPLDVLRRGGMHVTTVSVMPTTAVMAAQELPVVADAVLDDVDLLDFDLLVVPGGSGGVESLGKCQPLLDALVRLMADGDKLVGAICAGPTILAGLGLLEGRKATCYPGCEEGFPAGTYQQGAGVVRDGNLVTAAGPAFALAFGLELLGALAGEKAADQVAKGMLVRP